MTGPNIDALAPELLSSLSEADSHAQQQGLTGLRLGAFSLVRELGRGGMGTVWLANRVDGEFEQQVAIKLIQPGWHAAETNADSGNTNGEQITARELLDRGAARISDSLRDLPEAKAEMMETMGRAYLGLGLYEKSLRLFEPALVLRGQNTEPVALANALLLKASALKSLTRNAEASEVLAQAKLLMPQFPANSYAKKVEATILSLSGMLAFLARDYATARAELAQPIQMSRSVDGALNDAGIDTSLTLSRVLSSQKAFAEASSILTEAISYLRAAKPKQTQLLAEALDALGASESKRQRFAESAAAHQESAVLMEQVLGPNHWYVAIALNNFGSALTDQNLFSEAIAPLERAVRIAQVSLPETHGFNPVVLRRLAISYQVSGRYAEAKKTLQKVLTLLQAYPGITKAFDAADIKTRITAAEQAQVPERLNP